MAYVRKTKDRFKFSAVHLRRRAALLKAGMRARELEIVRLHDVQGLTFVAIGAQLGCSASRVRQVYSLGWRKLFSPGRRELVFPKKSPSMK